MTEDKMLQEMMKDREAWSTAVQHQQHKFIFQLPKSIHCDFE